MKRAALEMLEAAFSAEIEAALEKHRIDVFQTRKKKLAAELVRDGYLSEHTVSIADGPFTCEFRGYRLTEFGRLTYCMSDLCADDAASIGAAAQEKA